MILMASEHDLEPFGLINAFLEASTNGTSHYGGLKISCRSINQDSASFLIIKGVKAIWQFPLNLKMLQNPNFRESIKEIPMPEKKIVGPRDLKIAELKFGVKGVNVKAKIVDVLPTRIIFSRWSGLPVHVSNVEIADESGSIQLSLWNNQIKMAHVGDEVEIKNCVVARFRDELQLRLRRNSTISFINQPKEELAQYSISR